jgi:hypothetical protein
VGEHRGARRFRTVVLRCGSMNRWPAVIQDPVRQAATSLLFKRALGAWLYYIVSSHRHSKRLDLATLGGGRLHCVQHREVGG